MHSELKQPVIAKVCPYASFSEASVLACDPQNGQLRLLVCGLLMGD